MTADDPNLSLSGDGPTGIVEEDGIRRWPECPECGGRARGFCPGGDMPRAHWCTECDWFVVFEEET